MKEEAAWQELVGMEYKDYYQILDVSRNASQEEIKRAYRRLARELHPDVNPGDSSAEEHFKNVNEAYEVLSNPEKRSRYDQLGAGWNQWQSTRGPSSGFEDFARQWFGQSGQYGNWTSQQVTLDDILQGASGSTFADLLGGLLGGFGGASAGAKGGRARRGQDIEAAVELTLEEAYHGTTRQVERSDGHIVTAKIPPGVKTGSRIRLVGQGSSGFNGGPAGDIFLKARIRPHPTFRREGQNLYRDLPVDLYTAVLGGKVPVETLSGTVHLTIPAGTSGGQAIRLRGRGMPDLKKPENNGDLYAIVQIKVPSHLNTRERELFEELAQLQS